MTVRSAPLFTLSTIRERIGLTSMQQRCCNDGGVSRYLWQRVFAALGDWSSLSAFAGRSDILLCDRPERFRRFCPDCAEDTAHEGFDELGIGWYAQICRCQRCGRQGMRVWPLYGW